MASGKKLSTQEFIKTATEKHDNKYNYKNVIYKNIHTAVEIICSAHGSFFQSPNSHLTKGAGCPRCARKHYLTQEIFLDKAKQVHGERYDYSLITSYPGYDVPLQIICKIHGMFLQSARCHILSKHGCPKCGCETNGRNKRLSTSTFIKQATRVHGEKYNYSKTEYVTSNKKVEIICRNHGSFMQRPDAHVSKKRGCLKCANEQKGKNSVGGYHAGYFQTHPEKKTLPAYLYIVEMICGTDNFIKVGVTINTIKQRYSRTGAGGKHIQKRTLLLKPMPLYEAVTLESRILTDLKEYKYFPNYIFDGRTECLKNKPEVLATIASLLYPKVEAM